MKVSVLMTTYNQEKFIGQAIESVLMQRANFDYEIVIGEDCSTDRTQEIVKEYARSYPDKIRLSLREKNLGLQGKNNFIATLKACRGEYIAILDGDDYWIDPDKLQKQVDLLESYPQYAMCCTNFSVVDAEDRLLGREGWWDDKREAVVSHLTILKSYPPQPLTVLFRRSALPEIYPEEFFRLMNGDNFLFALITQHGDAAYMDIITGCYRRQAEGVWSSLNQSSQLETQFNTFSLMQNCFRELEEQKAIESRLYDILRRQLALYLRQFEIKKLWQTNQHLVKFGPVYILSAWSFALRSVLRNWLSASVIGQLLRFLRQIIRAQLMFSNTTSKY